MNVSAFNPAHRGEAFENNRASVVLSMGMVPSLDDTDGSFIVGPMGQSGQPGESITLI